MPPPQKYAPAEHLEIFHQLQWNLICFESCLGKNRHGPSRTSVNPCPAEMFVKLFVKFNPYPAKKLIYLNFHPLKVVSR